MRNKLFYLTRVSLNRKIKSKWFIIVNIVLFVVIAGLINIDNVINSFGGDFDKAKEVLVIDNTKDSSSYDVLNSVTEKNKEFIKDITKFKLVDYNKGIETAKKEIKKDDKIGIVIEDSTTNYIDVKIISNKTIDTILNQVLLTSLNQTKSIVALSLSNIDQKELASVNAPVVISNEYLSKDKNSVDQNMEMIMSTVFPVLILPFFMLAMFLIQMIGAEVNDEKTTRGMEIIISNVSPGVHFTSKIIAGNLFVFIQASILFLAGAAGLFIRNLIGSKSLFGSNMIDISGIINKLSESGIMGQLSYIIVLTVILMILSFIAYSLVAGILASMTTNIEDYQQIQTPLIIISVLGYYLAILAGLFEGSVFIRIMSYVPFISCLLSPSLLLMGQINIVDVLISITLLLGTIYLLVKYGLKIYKVGILNYSSSKLWTKMFKAIKETN